MVAIALFSFILQNPVWEGDFSAANVWGPRTTSSHYDRLSRLTRRARRMNSRAQTATEDCSAAILSVKVDYNGRSRCAKAGCNGPNRCVAAVNNGRSRPAAASRCVEAANNDRAEYQDANLHAA